MQVLTNTTKNWVKTPIVLWTLIATLFMMSGVYVALQANTASAAALTVVSDTLTTSAPATVAGHTFTFTTATALTTDATTAVDFNFFFQFPTATGADPFTINAITTADVTVSCSSGCGASPTFNVTAVTLGNLDSGDDAQNDNIKVEVDNTNADSRTMAAGAVFTVIIDNDPGITNPAKVAAAGTADPWSIDIETREGTSNTTEDTGTASVAIIEGVTVSVTVDESLSFSISGIADTTCASVTDGVGTEVTTTATTVPFGTVNSDAFYDGCLELQVGTNAANGYTATIKQDGPLTSPASNTIDEGDCDGTPACTDTTIAPWNTATNNGFAYCMRDSTGDAAATADANWTSGANQCGGTTQGFKTFPTVPTTEDIMSSAGALTANDITRTAFRISVAGSQEAGTYENVVEFVATPVF